MTQLHTAQMADIIQNPHLLNMTGFCCLTLTVGLLI